MSSIIIPQARQHHIRRFLSLIVILVLIINLLQPQFPVLATVTLTIEPIAWNVVGLDSNNVNVGPNDFPVGARVCNTGDTTATNITSIFFWDSSDPYINLRDGSATSFTGELTVPTLEPGDCTDFYYEIFITRNPAAYNHTRRYHITAKSTETSTISTPTPREIFVERLVSQNRNSINDVKVNGTSIPNGGSMSLLVGNTYDIEVIGQTATQGYQQLEVFFTLFNTVFRVNHVHSTYSATQMLPPYDKLYADSCGWDNDPRSPTYRSCIVSDAKSGGNITTIFNVTIIGGGGSNIPLSTMIYDFSGSSFHYNADYSTSARFVSVISPINFGKAFSPANITTGATSTLSFTITNPSSMTVTDVHFSDSLPSTPGQMTVATTPSIFTSSGCGSPTVSAPSGTTTISLSNGTIPAGATCTFSVVVTAPANGSYINTSSNLFFNNIDSGMSASANLNVASTSSGAGICGLTLAKWSMEPSQGTTVPPGPFIQAGNVATASASIKTGLAQDINTTTGSAAVNSWEVRGFSTSSTLNPTTEGYILLTLDTRNYTNIKMAFNYARPNVRGPANIAVYYGASSTPPQTSKTSYSVNTSWTPTGEIDFTGQTSTSSVTYFFIYGYSAGNTGADAYLMVDDITFTGCGPASKPTLSKSFAPSPIVENSTSTLSFTLSNSNSVTLTSVLFNDPLPSGLVVANPPAATTTCSGATFSPSAGTNTLSFSGGAIQPNATCTARVNVLAASEGVYPNISGYISSAESGTNSTENGYGAATLTVLNNPGLIKEFSPSPIYANQVSTLTFTLSNPNSVTLTASSFTDNLPSGVVVANPPSANTTCSGATFSPSAGASVLTFSGGAIPANGTCKASVRVTSSSVGDYFNVSSALTSASPITLTSSTASATLAVIDHYPGLKLLKQVAKSPSGPWGSFTLLPPGNDIYYRLTVENVGDVDMTGVRVTDPLIDMSGCPTLTVPFSLPTNDPVRSCVVGPFAAATGTVQNTATARGYYNGTPYSSPSTAEYVGVNLVSYPALNLEKQVSTSNVGPWVTSLTGVPAGSSLYYKFTVINIGNQDLATLTITDPLISTAGCDFINPLVKDGGTSICLVGPVTATTGLHTNTAYATSNVPLITSNYATATYSSGAYDIDGVTWLDENADGIIDGTETRLTDVTLKLYLDNGNGTFTPAEETYLGYQYSDLSGYYQFTNLPAGTYFVDVTDGINGLNLVSGGTDPRKIIITTSDSLDNNFGYQSPRADLVITKDDSTTAVLPGGSTTYAVRVTNNGPDTATGATLTDTFGAGITASGIVCSLASGNQCVSNPTLTDLESTGITLPSLTIGQFYEVLITTSVTASFGSVTNTASVTPGNPSDSNLTNNTATDTDAVNSADLEISKTNGCGYLVSGTVTTYTIRVTNQGLETVPVSTLTDVIDLGLSASAVVCSGAANNQCSSNPNLSSLLSSGVTLPALSVGQFYEIQLTATVIAASGTITNTAFIIPPDVPVDVNLTNNTATQTNDILPAGTPTGDLDITKTDGLSSISSGAVTTYTIRVTNNGPDSVAAATLTDVIGSGLTASAVGCSTASGNQCVTAPDLVTLTSGGITIPGLTAGQFYEIQLTATVTATGGTVINIASVTPPASPIDPNTDDNVATDTDSILTADLSISKTDGSLAVKTGETATYTIRVTNNGPDSISGATLTDTVGTGISPSGVICSSAASNQCASSPNLADLTSTGITLPSLQSGEFYEMELTGTITATSGSVINTASIEPPFTIIDPNPENNSATDTDDILNADLEVSKTDGQTTLNPGDTTTYTIRVTNNGPDAVTGAHLTDVVGAGISATGVACSADPSNQCIISPNLANLISTGITLPALASADFYEIELTGLITATNGSVVNTASVSSPFGPYDPDPSNNIATDTDHILNADLAITKTDGISALVSSETTTYTIRVTNNGPDVVAGATLTDAIGTGVSATAVVCSSAVGNACASAPDLGLFTSTGITLPALSSGDFYEVELTGQITATGGSVINSAFIVSPASPVDPVPGNNGATDTGYVFSADLEISKTDGVSSLNAGDSTTYTIRVVNNGPDAATGTVLTDNFGSGLSAAVVICSTASGNTCVSNPDLGDLTSTGITLPDLASGAFYEIELSGAITATSGSVTNTASITPPSTTVDPNPGNNTATDTDIVLNADLEISKTDGLSALTTGETATYAIRVTNNGPDSVTGATLTDIVGTGISPSSAACSTAPGNTCLSAPDLGALTSTGIALPVLASGAFYEIELSGVITAASGSVVNTASVSSPAGPVDPNPGNNTATDTDTVLNADLEISKTDGVSALTAGDTTTYTIRIVNNGPDTVSGATLTDSVGAGISPSNAACSTAPANQCASAPDLADLTSSGITLPTLSAGQFYEIELTATITASSGSVVNIASIAPPASPVDPNPGNNTATDTNAILSADLAITKTNGGVVLADGETTTYTIRVVNNGPDTASGAILTDTVGAGISATAVICSTNPGNQCVSNPDLATFTSTGIILPALANGEFYEIELSALVTASSGTVVNTAQVEAGSPVDPLSGNNTATETNTVVPAGTLMADLQISKSNGLTSLNPGDTTTYTIRLTNNGPDAISGATLTDTVGAGISATVVVCSSAPGNQCLSAPDLATLTSSGITIPSLTAGQFYEIEVAGFITATGGVVINTATVIPSTSLIESTPENNTATDTDTVLSADLEISKTDGISALTTGDTTTYAIRVTNNGPDTVTGATLTDMLGTGISATVVVCSTAPGNQCLSAPDPGNLTSSGILLPTLTAGAFYEIELSVFVTATGGTVINSASVTPPGTPIDVNPGNNTATDTDHVLSADLEIFKSDGVTALSPGETTTYTIRVVNHGPDPVTAATLTDTPDSGISATVVVCSATPGNRCNTAPNLVNLTTSGVPLPALASGEFYEIDLTVLITAASGPVVNTAVITPPATTVDPTPGNNAATDTDMVLSANLAVTKTNGGGNLTSGDTTTYTIRVTNNGPDTAIGATLTDTVGAGISATAVVCSTAPGNQCLTAPSLANLTSSGITLPTLTASQFYEIELTGLITATNGSVINTVEVTPPPGIVDPEPIDNTATETNTILPPGSPVADLSVTKTNGGGSFTYGDVTTYTIRVTNNGPDTANGATLTDTIGSGISATAVICSTAPANQCITAPDLASLVSTGITLPSLTAGQFYEIQMTALVTATSGTIVNTASVTPPPGIIDPEPVNTTSTQTNTVTPPPVTSADLMVTKTNGGGDLANGDTTTYTIRATNNGPDSVAGATLTDTLGSGISALSLTCTAAPGNQCTTTPDLTSFITTGITLPTLTASQFYEVELTAIITAYSGAVVNTASIIPPPGPVDPEPVNNTATQTNTITSGFFQVFLPYISNPLISATQTWGVGLGYEDLPMLTRLNDFDYNDWYLTVDGLNTYTSPSSGLLQRMDLNFTPRSRGAAYDHQFQIVIPASTFQSNGVAILTIRDGDLNVISVQTIPFAGNAENVFTLFEHTSMALPGTGVNTIEGNAPVTPLRFTSLSLTFSTPFPFTVSESSLSSAHGKDLFFDPYLNVQDTNDKIHAGDVRLLSVPSTVWLWPEETVRIDRAYPAVTFKASEPPVLTFPNQWWTSHNHCVVDGIACGTYQSFNFTPLATVIRNILSTGSR
ncbi:MAG TPA: SdrD B-like domain-containing protein [Anaerolineaceae bacterium]|nr:SdrD B-like domain-containing protein [Anaerolineaceae bacterium]HPN51968.1 SdrD B-like domain-containing protein [Anaerolineaceae bacterium]